MKIPISIENPVFKQILVNIFNPSLKYKANILENVIKLKKYQSQKCQIYHTYYLSKV